MSKCTDLFPPFVIVVDSIFRMSAVFTAPPFAKRGIRPELIALSSGNPTFLTASALRTYSPLDNQAGMLSDVAVPGPLIGPPVASPNIPKPELDFADISCNAVVADPTAVVNAVNAPVALVFAPISAGFVPVLIAFWMTLYAPMTIPPFCVLPEKALTLH